MIAEGLGLHVSESGLPTAHHHTHPDASGTHEQQFSFVAAHIMGQGSSGRPLSHQSCKPPLPPSSPSNRGITASGSRSPQHGLRRSSSERGAFFNEHSHCGVSGEGLAPLESEPLTLSRRKGDGAVECPPNASTFPIEFTEHCSAEAATSTLADFFSSDGYCNFDVDTLSPLDQLLMDQDLAPVPGL